MSGPRPGDFFVSKATRRVFGGAMSRACRTSYIHSGIYVGHGDVVHTSDRFPSGAKLDPVRVLVEPQWSDYPLQWWDRERIVDAAYDLIGTPYPSKLPIIVGLVRQHRGDITRPYPEQPWWVRQLLNGEHTAYCQQIVTRAYWMAGIDLFGDGRPADLARPHDLLRFVPGAS